MVKKSEDYEKMLGVVSENPEILEQFKEFNVLPATQPSILLTGGIQELDIVRLTPKEVEASLLMHPVIPRGIEIKANRMTGRGFNIEPIDDSPEAKEAADEMRNLLMDSGGEILINGWIQDAYAFGNSYITLLPDKETGDTVFLSREHPMFFRIARKKKKNVKKTNESIFHNSRIRGDFVDEYGPMKIDPATKKPLKYTQVIFANSSKERVKPVGTEIDKDKVAHLVFNTWGDEAEGIGLVQYVHLILKYIMNIEEAGAEAIFRSGFTQKAIETTIKTEKDLKKLAKELDNINASDSIILPDGTTVSNLQPGQTQFAEVHDVLLNLIAIRLGIPKPILTLDGTDTNKATMRELMRDLIFDLRADEAKVKRTIEEQIFEPACKSIFGDGFEKFPIFNFRDFEEGKEEKANILDITSQYVKRLTESANIALQAGMQDEARTLINFMVDNLPVDDLVDEKDNKQEQESDSSGSDDSEPSDSEE